MNNFDPKTLAVTLNFEPKNQFYSRTASHAKHLYEVGKVNPLRFSEVM